MREFGQGSISHNLKFYHKSISVILKKKESNDTFKTIKSFKELMDRRWYYGDLHMRFCHQSKAVKLDILFIFIYIYNKF